MVGLVRAVHRSTAAANFLSYSVGEILDQANVSFCTPAGSGKVLLLAVRIVFLNRVQNLQIHVMRANQYICIFSQFSEFRIQNMHSTL